MSGVNGSGNTTTAGKVAHKLASDVKRVLLVAADTFRAGAAAQLAQWKRHENITVLMGKEQQEPASLIFDGCSLFIEEQYDHIIIDTAGRLQTKVNLMNELEKVFRIINKKLPNIMKECLLTIDAMLGQNALTQAKKFSESAPITGLVLTKFDGTGKGGTIFAITKELALPVNLVTFGESINDIKWFNYGEYINELLDSYES